MANVTELNITEIVEESPMILSLPYDTLDWKLNALYMIGFAFLIVFGVIGNSFAIYVWRSRYFKNVPTAMAMTALAISDMLTLLVGGLRQFSISATGKDVRLSSEALCKLHVFLLYWGVQTSAWYLVVITWMRVIGLLFPLKAKIWMTKRVELIILIVVCVLTFCLNAFILEGVTKGFIHGADRCYAKSAKFLQVKKDIDQIVGSFIPFAFIFVGNIIIIVQYYRFSKEHSTLTNNASEKDNFISTSIMFMCISLAFLITSAPSLIILRESHRIIKELGVEKENILWHIFQIVFYSNYVLNFYLYCASGKSFRVALFKLLSPKDKSSHSSMTTTRIKKSTASTAETIP